MLTNVFQHNFTRWRYVKQHVKPHPNRKILNGRHYASNLCIFVINLYRLKTKHRRATYKLIAYVFSHFFLGDSTCSHLKSIGSQTEVIFKV